MKDTKRALRRHHRQRMIARSLWIVRGWHGSEEDRLWRAMRLYKNRQFCSCAMCGHRRKWYGPTIQERRWGIGKAQSYDDGDRDEDFNTGLMSDMD